VVLLAYDGAVGWDVVNVEVQRGRWWRRCVRPTGAREGEPHALPWPPAAQHEAVPVPVPVPDVTAAATARGVVVSVAASRTAPDQTANLHRSACGKDLTNAGAQARNAAVRHFFLTRSAAGGSCVVWEAHSLKNGYISAWCDHVLPRLHASLPKCCTACGAGWCCGRGCVGCTGDTCPTCIPRSAPRP
jgi:hypothetical protein